MGEEDVQPFEDRIEAARGLAMRLGDLKGKRPLVLGVPRGAVPMAKVIADELEGDLDLVLVKKIGHPFQPEFAIGSVTEDGQVFLGMGALRHGITHEELEAAALQEATKLRENRIRYTGSERPAVSPKNRLVIIVDDGIATGATMNAAVKSLKSKGAKRIIVAVPVASHEAIRFLEAEGVEVRALRVPEFFGAVSYYYRNFSQVSDAEVGEFFRVRPVEVNIEREGKRLKALIGQPTSPAGVVIFAHGSGSGRLSPRNHFVADFLNRHGIATVLADLLTEEEAADRANVFDIGLLADRLGMIVHWVRGHPDLKFLPVGFFGASTGGGAALRAAVLVDVDIAAVVSRGGRPDLAGAYLTHVRSPTLLIVGGEDPAVIGLNVEAFDALKCEKKLEIVAGATHLFEEPGALEAVAELATAWFHENFMTEASRSKPGRALDRSP